MSLICAEVHEGAHLTVSTQLLGFDWKRIHAMQIMVNNDDEYVAATCEVMSLHVSEETRRVSEMHPDAHARLEEIWESHKELETPPQVGQVIGVPGESTDS